MTERLKAKVGPKGQAVIPKPIRDELGIKPGDEVYFTAHGRHAHVDKRTSTEALDAWFASLREADGSTALDAAAIKRTIEAQYDEERRRFHA